MDFRLDGGDREGRKDTHHHLPQKIALECSMKKTANHQRLETFANTTAINNDHLHHHAATLTICRARNSLVVALASEISAYKLELRYNFDSSWD
jgi:hypothetical protein